uniref:Uncharacterized protein n=1 Tax=Zea mays TaxID=4577 RepID=A0A804N117_MAIZE
MGSARRERDRDRAVAASYGVRSRSARAWASPPPRQVPRDRSVRRSPSPAAKRRALSEPRRAASPTPSVQRKPPVPARPAGRVSPRRRAQFKGDILRPGSRVRDILHPGSRRPALSAWMCAAAPEEPGDGGFASSIPLCSTPPRPLPPPPVGQRWTPDRAAWAT